MAIVGPESTGKTTLARALAQRHRTHWVAEYARAYLHARGGAYDATDLPRIASGQLAAERRARGGRRGRRLLLLDTDLVVLQVWSEVRFRHVDAVIARGLRRVVHRRYLLLAPDLPWQPDPLRENPHDRDVLFEHYRRVLDDLGARYAIVRGRGPARAMAAERALRRLARTRRRRRPAHRVHGRPPPARRH